MKNSFLLSSLIIVLLAGGCGLTSQATPTPEIPVQMREGTVAEAKIIPVQNATISFSGTGKITEIMKFEGDWVKKGDVIARLEGVEKAQASISGANYLVIAAQKDLDDLYEKANLASAESEMVLAQAKLDLEDALDKRDDLNYGRVNQYMLEGIQSQLIIAQQAVEDAETTYSYVEDKAIDDVTRAEALAYLSQTRLYRDQIQRNYEYASGPPELNDIAKADAEVARMKALVEDAQRAYNRRKEGPYQKDIDLGEANLKNAKAQADVARANLADLELAAPFNGVLVANDLKVGEVATAGATVTIGDLSAWQVQTTDLKEVDIIGIEAGQEVKILVDAIPDLEMTGIIERIKAIGVDVRGDNTYVVYILLKDPDPRILWNMTAKVTFPSAEEF
ncbi:MAG: HlyD family secretion protein [Anaerolineaceae bacterium]